MNKPIPTNPTANVKANWTSGEIVTAASYNTQAGKINESLTDIGTLNDAFASIQDILTGTSAPASNLGKVGDLYIQTE